MAARDGVIMGLLGLWIAAGGLACHIDNPAFDQADQVDQANGAETQPTKDSQTTDAGDGDPGDGDGDGDGDPIPGDGDGDPIPGDGDGEPIPGDGDGEPVPGDGDGEPNIVCEADPNDPCDTCIAELCCNEDTIACKEDPGCVCMLECLLLNDNLCLQQCALDDAGMLLATAVHECVALHCPNQCQ